jgi:hypothetical protein
MADKSGGSGSKGAQPNLSTVPREKPVVESQAQEIEAPRDSSNEIPPEDPWAPLPGPATAEVMPEPVHASVEPLSVAPAETRGARVPPASLWLFAAAIVLAALLAIGGAFGLHFLDKTPAHLAALESLVGTLETRQNPAQGLEAAQKDLASRIAALEAANAAAKAAIATMRTELDRLAAQKSAPSAAPDLAPLEAHLAALDQKLAALGSSVGGLAQTLNAEKGQVRASENSVSQSAAANAGDEAIAILAASLVRKVESGAPYGSDLTALANRGLDRAKLAPLEPAAQTGVATVAALAQQFSDFTSAILATEPQPKENGFLDHLVQGAERLVRVEKLGDTSGSDLKSEVARIQAALDSGAIDAAYQEWSALPDAAKAKSASFGAAAKARLQAIAAARGIDAEAVAALGRPRS